MTLKTSILSLLGGLSLALALACDGSSTPPPPPPPVAVAVLPTTATLITGASQTFTATVTGSANTAVTWSVQEGTTGGAITTAGVYTAPATAGVYHVVATSAADTTKRATAEVTVNSVGISISPTTANLLTGGTQTFTAAVTGSTNTTVTWSIQEGASGGSITTSGVYTAPATPGTYHVVATSVADTSKRAMATVTVTQVSVSVSPTTANLITGGSAAFTATVTGTTNTAVTWSILQGTAGGSITSVGVYTAPSTPGTYQVVGTSVADPSKSATATVTVTEVGVSLSPNAVDLFTGRTQAFLATVTGTSNMAVTWSIQEGPSGGSITTSGVYTAPTTAGTYHVVATSVADPSKSATATVTVFLVGVSVSPTTADLLVGGTQAFNAIVTGTTNTAISWSVQEAAGGSITAGGVYTAPATSGTYHVVATSVADSTKSAIATVTVTPISKVLDYVDPTVGMYRLVKNTAMSTSTHLVLDLVAVSGPSGAGVAFTFSADSARVSWAKVEGSDTELVQNGLVLNLGSTPQILKGKAGAGTLTGSVSQKGNGTPVTLNGVLARVALDLKPGLRPGSVALAAPKARILLADGSRSSVTVSVGTLTAN